MRALLLAAGKGTRLRPITNHIPKCLVPIHGKPLLEYWLDLLLGAGVEKVLINTHYLSDQVRKFIGGSPWRDHIDLLHEDSLLGTGGTVLKGADFFKAEPFMVAHADNLTRFDVTAFVQRHERRPAGVEITMMTFATDTPESCGIVFENKDGVVIDFFEKVAEPPGNHANGAVYIFEPSVIQFLSALNKKVIDLSTEVIPNYMGKICTFHNENYHRDIGTPESLRMAELEFA